MIETQHIDAREIRISVIECVEYLPHLGKESKAAQIVEEGLRCWADRKKNVFDAAAWEVGTEQSSDFVGLTEANPSQAKEGTETIVAFFVALVSALLEKPLRGSS